MDCARFYLKKKKKIFYFFTRSFLCGSNWPEGICEERIFYYNHKKILEFSLYVCSNFKCDKTDKVLHHSDEHF